MCKVSVRIRKLGSGFGIACFGISESVCSDSCAYPFNIVVEVGCAFCLCSCAELHKRFAFSGACIGKIIEPELAGVVNSVAFSVFFKKKKVENCVCDIVVNRNLVYVFKDIFGSLVYLIVNFFGLIGACPIINGRILHIALHSKCLHICHFIKFYGNTENATGKSSYNRAFHTVVKIGNGLFAVFRTFGTKGENFIKLIGLNFRMLICVHIVFFLYNK